MISTARPTRNWRRLAAAAVAAGAVLLTSVAPVSNAVAAAGIDVVGRLEIPWLEPDEDPQSITPRVGALDAERQRLYLFINRHRPQQNSMYLAEYDTSTEIPTPLRISEAPVTTAILISPERVVVDRSRNRVLVLSFKKENDGNRSVVDVVDLDTLARTQTWELSVTVPGYVPMAFTHDANADRIYVVGEFGGLSAVDRLGRTPGRPVGPGPAIVALEGETGSLVWIRPLTGCRSILQNTVTGAFIARSSRRPALYTFCDSGGVALNQVLLGESALVRVHITDDADASAALDFPVETFPVSGQYVTPTSNSAGIVGFDPASERVFAQSLSARTAGGWVFDGLRSAWVGFVAAQDTFNYFLGVNPANGRYYMAGYSSGGPGYINVTDGRSTPVAQGTTVGGLRPNSYLTPDPAGRRVFAVVDHIVQEEDIEAGVLPVRWQVPMVLRDNTPPIQPLSPVDYDALTADLPDADASLTFSSGASGFGARYELVGGVEGGSGRIGSGQIVNPVGLALGDRGTTLALVPRVDIRTAGASATAAAASLGEATESDRSGAAGELETAGAPSDALAFPYGVHTCLDGSGERIDDGDGVEGDLGRAAVACDLAALEATGSAAFSERVGAGGISVAGATFDTRTYRDAKRGAMTESLAIAEGVVIRIPNGPRVVIDRIATTATTAANGRPSTAAATWERSVEGVTIVNADGAASPLQSCATTVANGAKEQRSGDCEDLARQINQTLATEARVRFPIPQLTATPRGAFASVEEPERAFLDGLTTNNDDHAGIPGMEAVVFNDGAEKSRLLVQLATIRADSIFTRSPIPTFDSGTTGTAGTATGAGGNAAGGAADVAPSVNVDDQVAGGNLGNTSDGLAPPVVADGALGVPAGSAGQGVVGWLIGARSPAEAAMAAGVWSLFAAALAVAWRRRRLIETLGG